MQNQTDYQNKNQDPYSDEAQLNARFSSKWYDLISSTITKCPFCDLKSKYFVLEKKLCVLTVNTFPYDDGHLLVIPKRHVETIKDLSNDEWSEMQQLIKIGMEVLRKRFGYKDFNNLYREGGKKSGQSVRHFHLHILPVDKVLNNRQGGFDLNFQKLTQLPIKTAEELRNIIKQIN